MTVKSLLEDVFLRKKPVHVIMSLASCNPQYVSILSKETDCTHSHTVKLLETLKDLGLVEFQKSGRIRLYMIWTRHNHHQFLALLILPQVVVSLPA